MSLFSHPAERRTLVYLLAISALMVLHWQLGHWSALLTLLSIAGAFAVSAMHHNHAHHPIWRHTGLNRLTDYWYVLLQGHPGFAFAPLHVGSHHEHHNGPQDLTRTYRFRAGNDLVGLLRHPAEFSYVALGQMAVYLRRSWATNRVVVWHALGQYGLLIAMDGGLLLLDWRRALYCVIVPQAAALFFLLASNYFQHAGGEGESEWNHARNFTGAINPLCFNVGYHTAHHYRPQAHWSELPSVHREIAANIAPALIERSFVAYCWRRFIVPAGLQSQPSHRQEHNHG